MIAAAPILSVEVQDALRLGAPVVALESSVIAQGLPVPQNLDAYRRMVQAIRQAHAVPALIAVLGGQLRIGLDDLEVQLLARGAAKASVRDLAALVAAGGDAGTTVAATVALASLVGIRVFATGGIGGVHRRASESFDISADLHEIARQPVAIVAAGIKNLLDIPATLEVLETLGVPVVGLGTREMPGFLTRETGIRLEHQVADAQTAARLLRVHWQVLHRTSGVLFFQPVPREQACEPKLMQEALERALEQCAAAHIRGKEQTPFILHRLSNLTAGRSLIANLALLEHNAAQAAQLAVALASKP